MACSGTALLYITNLKEGPAETVLPRNLHHSRGGSGDSHTKPTDTPSGQNTELLNIKVGCVYANH
jgi:hypothetical protein